MLKHCVFANFQTNYSQEERHTLLAGFAEVAKDVPGMLGFCFGKNLDFEVKSAGYSDGFVVTFTNREAHLAYESHPNFSGLNIKQTMVRHTLQVKGWVGIDDAVGI